MAVSIDEIIEPGVGHVIDLWENQTDRDTQVECEVTFDGDTPTVKAYVWPEGNAGQDYPHADATTLDRVGSTDTWRGPARVSDDATGFKAKADMTAIYCQVWATQDSDPDNDSWISEKQTVYGHLIAYAHKSRELFISDLPGLACVLKLAKTHVEQLETLVERASA